MQPRRTLATFFLLMAYLLGYAHSLLPHGMAAVDECAITAEEGRAILHQHHALCEDALLPPLAKETGCITHIDHCDESFLDFLICLIAETHAPDDAFGNAHQLPGKQPFGKSFKPLFAKKPALLLSLITPDEEELSSRLPFPGAEDEPLPPAPFFGHAVLRGPPLS